MERYTSVMHDASWMILVIIIPIGVFISGTMFYLYIAQVVKLYYRMVDKCFERSERGAAAFMVFGCPAAFIGFTCMWIYPCYLAVINGALK